MERAQFVELNSIRKEMKHNILLYISLATTMLWSCSTDNIQESDNNLHGVSLSSSIVSFEGEQQTKVNLAGNGFEDGDMIRIKVICPYVSSQEAGESTYGGTYDGFWVQKWSGSGWTSIPASDGFDFNGDYQRSGGSSIIGQVLSQQTPYVFTASTWTEEKVFKIGGKMVVQYANVFHADQSNPTNYKASDVLWAQNIMQTATDMIHFDFHHVMAALKITVADNVTLSDKAVLTIENMPDIDQAEIIVGDMFAAKSKVNSMCGYMEKHQCTDDDNGKALGIGVNSTTGSSTRKFENIYQTATYKAMRRDNTKKEFQLIVPPCTITYPVVWIRDGESRWKVALGETTFKAGKMYNITLNLQSQTE